MRFLECCYQGRIIADQEFIQMRRRRKYYEVYGSNPCSEKGKICADYVGKCYVQLDKRLGNVKPRYE